MRNRILFEYICIYILSKLISSGETSSNRDIFSTDDATKNFLPTSKISAQEIRHQFFHIWSNLTITAHIMGLGNQSESFFYLSAHVRALPNMVNEHVMK